MDYDPCAPIHSVDTAAPAPVSPVHHHAHRFTGHLFGRIKASRPRHPSVRPSHRAVSTACERASKTIPAAAAAAPAAVAAKPILLAGGALTALGGAGALIGSSRPSATTVPAHGVSPAVVNVPEPASIALFAVAALAAFMATRFRRQPG